MKKTQFIELCHKIKSNVVSFVATILFVALGIAFFTGLSWSADGFLLSVHNEVEDAALYDAEIVYPYGFDEEDISKIATIDGVDEIEGFRSDYLFIEINEKNVQIKINEIGDKLNRFVEIEGVIPKAENEIAFEKTYADANNVKIGDIMVFKSDAGTEQSHLKVDEFKVTALVISPLYLGKSPTTYGFSDNNIAIDGQAFVCDSAFKENALNTYSSVSIRCNALRGLNTFSKEYSAAVNEFIDSIDAEISDIIDARYDKVCTYTQSDDKLPICGYIVTPRMYNAAIIALKISGDSFYKTRFFNRQNT